MSRFNRVLRLVGHDCSCDCPWSSSIQQGNAEIAAYRLYQALRESEGWEQSCFLAACPDHSMLKPGCEVFGLSESEWLIRRSSDPLLHDTNINLTTTEHGFLHSVLKT